MAKKSRGQKTAEAAKKKAQSKLKTYSDKAKVKPLNKQQIEKRDAAKETKRTADIYIKAARDAKGMSYEDLQEKRTEEMVQRGGEKGQTKFDEALQARAYADYMRQETGRQKGQGTPYVGPGVQIYVDDEGDPDLSYKTAGGVEYPEGRVKYGVDTEAYLKRFIPSFQPTAEQLARTGGPGGWAQGLLGGDEDYTYLTPWQQTNLQTLLGSGEDIEKASREDIALGIMGLPKSLRTDWRQETWGDVFNERTGLWERADPTKRAAAVEDQLRRYDEGLFNPYTGQPEESTGPAPWENVKRIWDILGDDTTTTNLNNTLNRTPGSAFVHPYAADPYTVPHMETGGLWEGLGAEYQPGTVEGLGLLAGDAYAPYEPLAKSLLDAQPAYTPTGGVFNKVGGEYGGQFLGYDTPDGSTSSDSWSPTWQFTTVNGGQQYGYFNQGGQWVRGGDQSS